MESRVFLVVHRKIRASTIGDRAHKSHSIPMLMRDEIGNWPFRSPVHHHRYSRCLLISYQAHTILALVIFFSCFFVFFSLNPNVSVTKTSRLILQSPIAKSEDEHLFPCSKINFSSLLLREASRITPISRGFDGSLLRVLRTCENKNIAFLGREVDATLFT